MDLREKKVLVVGFERTGQAVARFLVDRGARVRVSERKPAQAFGDRLRELAERGVVFETGGHRLESFLEADLIVPSPGVPPIPEIRAALERGVPVLSELELAFRFLRGTIVAVTGSNGKSTTATLIHRVLKEAGLRSRLAGNIGTPLIALVDRSRDADIHVTEVSSFQLEYTEAFAPRVAVFLNISENHLDWHKTFDAYFAAKRKILRWQGPGSSAVLNRDQPLVWGLADSAAATVVGFSRKRRLRRGSFLETGWVAAADGRTERLLPVSSIKLPGAHNLENVLAAVCVARLFDVPSTSLRRSVAAFRGLEHRLEDVLTVGGVRFVNDSKATTVDATLKALASFDRPVVLILGGRSKGGDFSPLRREVRRRARAVVLIGEAAPEIEAALGGVVPVERASDYRDVVRRAFARAARGDVVLLAPAATSWDMFKDFEERGRVFKREVRRLASLRDRRALGAKR